jgi:predicted RNase H-like HicB family nuclease
MQPFGYRIVTEWSNEDQAFIARVPALVGCAAHGATPEDAAREAREAAAGILDSIEAHHETPPPEDASVDYSGQLRLRLPKSLHERIALLATAEELSINSLLVSMISEAVGQRRAQAPRRAVGTVKTAGRSSTAKAKFVASSRIAKRGKSKRSAGNLAR